jgi:hypothetical protein
VKVERLNAERASLSWGYAHTDDALRNVILGAASTQVYHLFGCGEDPGQAPADGQRTAEAISWCDR